MNTPDPAATGPARDTPSPWRALLRELSQGKVGWTLGFALTVALLLNPIFLPPFPVLLGRTVFVALVLLLAYTAAGHGSQRWLPRWLLQALAVALAAPLASALVYLVATGGDLGAFLGNEHRVAGFLWIAGTALFLGLILALGAMVRERDAQAQALQLQFELERNRLERQALDARLALLTAQVEPHFLFNTLANVRALVDSGSPRAGPVLGSLLAYLRAALPKLHREGAATLADELGLVRAYLELMQLRMPDRLQWTLEVPATMQALAFPPMALLTLVENAVRHGIDPSEEGGRIEVGAAPAADGSCRIWVSDSGVGLADTPGAGTGLANLRDRLAALYGPQASLELRQLTAHGAHAEIRLPAPQASA